MKKLVVTIPLVFSLVGLLGLAPAASAQAPPPPPPGAPGGNPGGPQGGPPPDVILKEVLSFTQAQMDALQNLLEGRAQAVQALQKQLPDAEKALADAVNATPPDPATVGAKFLAVAGIRKQIGQAENAFKTSFDNLLTVDQKSKVQAIRGLETSLTAGQVLHLLGAI